MEYEPIAGGIKRWSQGFTFHTTIDLFLITHPKQVIVVTLRLEKKSIEFR